MLALMLNADDSDADDDEMMTNQGIVSFITRDCDREAASTIAHRFQRIIGCRGGRHGRRLQ